MSKHNITLVKQPVGSKLCGQACLAMVLGVTLEAAILFIGHRRGTKTRELVWVLRNFALIVPDRLRVTGERPPFAIAKQPHRRGSNWHWVVIWHGKRYDPLGEEEASYGERLTSYLPISEGVQ